MEHVVFFPAADGTPQFRRTPTLQDAVQLVEQLRNGEGVQDATVHALHEVPLSFKTYYRVEVPALLADAGTARDDDAADNAPPPPPVLVAEPPALALVSDAQPNAAEQEQPAAEPAAVEPPAAELAPVAVLVPEQPDRSTPEAAPEPEPQTEAIDVLPLPDGQLLAEPAEVPASRRRASASLGFFA